MNISYKNDNLSVNTGNDASINIEFTMDTTKFQHSICEFLVGHDRWEVVKEFEHAEEHFRLTGVKIKDIYPLIGGKHKKYKVCVVVQAKNGEVHAKEFVSSSGNEDKIARIWPEVNRWIMDMTGIPTHYAR